MSATAIQSDQSVNTKAIVLFHTIAVALIALPFFWCDAARYGWNCVFAGLLVGVNLLLLIWVLKGFLQKKSVALMTSTIVFKYAVLIGLLFLLEQFGWRVNIGFLVGLAALFPTLGFIVYRYWLNLKEQTNEIV